MKFSIIIPVYNVYDYLDKCLSSILDQNYDNYEVIIVNDGTKDNSQEIIDKYTKLDKRFKCYKTESVGVSAARNFGVKKATGDYIIFVDGDDYIGHKLLSKVKEEADENSPDIIRYQIRKIFPDHEEECLTTTFSNMPAINAFRELMKSDLFITVWSGAYKRTFYNKYKFQFPEGRIHEDFGLTPLIYLCSSRVSSISYIGYNYVRRANSIMTTDTKKNNEKRNKDMLYHFEVLLDSSSKLDVDYKTLTLFRSFISNSLIVRCKDLEGAMLNDYVKELKRLKVADYLLDDTFSRNMKKQLIKIAPKIYIKLFLK